MCDKGTQPPAMDKSLNIKTVSSDTVIASRSENSEDETSSTLKFTVESSNKSMSDIIEQETIISPTSQSTSNEAALGKNKEKSKFQNKTSFQLKKAVKSIQLKKAVNEYLNSEKSGSTYRGLAKKYGINHAAIRYHVLAHREGFGESYKKDDQRCFFCPEIEEVLSLHLKKMKSLDAPFTK